MIAESSAGPGQRDPRLVTICVLIPVWRPSPDLPGFVRALLARGFGRILVVDDGGGPEYTPIFGELKRMHLVDVVEHPTNRGKGRALKSGLLHLQQEARDLTGVVTADADGQHLPDDVARVGLRLLESGGRCVLGTRTFDRKAPFGNRIGNQLTAVVFRALTRCKISDTQTGLRGLPRSEWQGVRDVPGERYEYETAVLVALCRSGKAPLEEPIQTVYLNGNRSTHFRPFRDALGIYGALFKAVLGARPGPSR